MSYYMHNVPGRLRVKTPVIKGNTAMSERVTNFLDTVDGVTSITANTVTGSIVVLYDPLTVSHKQLVDALSRKGYFDHTKAVTNDQYVHKAASKASWTLGKVVFGAAVDMALEGSALSLLTVLL